MNKNSNKPEELIAGYHRFREGYFLEHQKKLTMLSKGQSPNIAVLSCCDSRVDPTIIFDTPPGELFVIRNIANLVPSYENDGRPKGTSSALEFAVMELKVSHLVVLGHAQCGGVRALMDRKSNHTPSSFVDQWMAIVEPIKQDILSQNLPAEDRYAACEKAVIRQSLQNLMTFPWVEERVREKKLTLHGWYYDLNTATLSFDQETDSTHSPS